MKGKVIFIKPVLFFLCLQFFAACSFFDNEAPEITIITPENDDEVEASFVIRGTAKDNYGVKTVYVKVDDGDYETADGSAEKWLLYISLSGTGLHIITVKAEDYNDNAAYSIINVNYSTS